MNYLQKSLQFFKSKELGRTFSIYTTGKIIGFMLSFLLLPLFTKKLPTVEFGVIGLLWLINPILSRAITLGMDVGITIKFFKQAHQELSSTIYNGLLSISFLAFLIWCIGCIHIKWIHLIIDKSVTPQVFTLLVLSALFSIYSTLMCSFLKDSGKAVSYVVANISISLITVVTTYIFTIYVSASYVSYIGGMALSNCIIGTIALGYFLKNYPIRHFRFNLQILKNLLRIGVPVLPSTIGGIILSAGDRYMIKYFIGLEAVAIYTFGYRFAELISQGLFEPFQKAFIPILFKKAVKDTSEARSYNIWVVNNGTILFSIIIAAIMIPIPNIMNIIGGSVYTYSYLIFLVSLIGAFVYNISQAESPLLMFIERTEINMLSIVIGASGNIGLNLLLIPYYGIIAAAYTTIISYLAMMILRNYFSLHFFKIKNFSQLMWRIVPLAVYVYIIYCTGIFVKGIIATYFIKCSIFVIYFVFIWFCFAEYRNLIKSIVFNKQQITT